MRGSERHSEDDPQRCRGTGSSRKGRSGEKGNKHPSSLLFLRNPLQKAIVQKFCMKRCCSVHGMAPRPPRYKGAGHPPVLVGERLVVTTRQDTRCLSPFGTTKDAELGKSWAIPASWPPARAVGACGGLIPGRIQSCLTVQPGALRSISPLQPPQSLLVSSPFIIQMTIFIKSPAKALQSGL